MFIVKGKLSKYEFDKIVKELSVYKSKRIVQAGIYGQETTINQNFRKGNTAHPHIEDAPNTYNILHSIIFEEYNRIYNFTFKEVPEIQYAFYNTGDFFKKHKDTINGQELFRSLTFSLNLSDPSKYSGGDLVIFDKKNNDKEVLLEKEKGSYVIFPSFYFHEAQEVKSGEREAMVCWLRETKFNHFKFEEYVNNF